MKNKSIEHLSFILFHLRSDLYTYNLLVETSSANLSFLKKNVDLAIPHLSEKKPHNLIQRG